MIVTCKQLYHCVYHRKYLFPMRVWCWRDQTHANGIGFTDPNGRVSVRETGDGIFEIYFHKLLRKVSFVYGADGIEMQMECFNKMFTASTLMAGEEFNTIHMNTIKDWADKDYEFSEEISEEFNLLFSNPDKPSHCPMS